MAPSNIPPPLPPTVEEAYRRKCVQLKQRTKEVENANEAAHLRLNRMKRQVEKMRLERAFLLEQLARRTSTNVEDSEGSPSPPPTPKDKPLRTKRGHRKGSLLATGNNTMETPPPPGGHVISGLSAPPNLLTAQNLRVATHSPSSDAFSHSHADNLAAKSANGGGTGSANGKQQGGPKKGAFELYAEERRPGLLEKAAADEDVDEDDDAAARRTHVEDELSRGWQDLSEDARGKYQDLADKQRDRSSVKKEDAPPRSSHGGGDRRSSSSAKPTTAPQAGAAAEDTPTATQDEDVEMGNYNDSDQETQGEKQDE
ncbi:hypothetical protein GE09DRAFT_1283632 [Coniochaeta sp. 2T2.1]|nr:hypothetical protein GE09DRAFT_1283632 [Coniochaeta sp. 2T2.1]